MPRPRKPTKILELSGAFLQNPQRKRPAEPIPTGELGPAPDYMPVEVGTIWSELAEPAHWLTAADRAMLEGAALRLHRMRTDPGFKATPALISALARLGFSPADRARVSVPAPKPITKWDRPPG